MPGTASYLYSRFISSFGLEATECQDNFFRSAAEFISSDEDIMVLNGYAGTGKTTAVSALVDSLKSLDISSILLAPTGRSAKVLSSYSGYPACTVHKHIYRQKSVGGSYGYGQFSLSPNKAKNTLFVVDEVSLIGVESQAQSSAVFGSGNLLEDLITFIRSGVDCKLLLIGDSAQLPPVGMDVSPALDESYMRVLGCRRFATMRTVVRQGVDSGILANATHIRSLMDEFRDTPLERSSLGLRDRGFGDVRRIVGGDLIECISDAYAEYGEDRTVVLCRSNRRAVRYNIGIRNSVQFKEESLVYDDRLMIVKNCYQFLEEVKGLDYIANGDIAALVRIASFEERYGLHFAEARLRFPDYNDVEIKAKVILDTLQSESVSLTPEQQNALYNGVNEDYAHIASKRKRWEAVREDKYFNALQLKYANALTCHKSQGGQWDCVFIDNAFRQDDLMPEDLKWLYTAMTRAVRKVYLVNFDDCMFV